MNLSLPAIGRSLAAYLAPLFPDTVFYEDAVRQVQRPCLFLHQRYGAIRPAGGGRFLRQIGWELTYLADDTLPGRQLRYQQAAETLDIVMETFPYTDGESGTELIRTYDREWRIDLDAMHYKFELQVWVDVPTDGTPMQTMDYSEDVSDGS